MEEIQEQVERLIDDIESNSNITTIEISEALHKLKEEIEEHQIRKDEGDLHRDFSFEDLD